MLNYLSVYLSLKPDLKFRYHCLILWVTLRLRELSLIKESKLANGGVTLGFQVGFVEFLLFTVYTLPTSPFLKLVSVQHCSADVDGGFWRVPVHMGTFRALETSATKKYFRLYLGLLETPG